MKKLLFLAAFVLAAQVTFAQAAAASQSSADYAVATVDNPTHDFGKIKQGVPVTHEFVFVNKGKVPMIITNAQPSCGCTVPSWTKDPIPPGGSGFVKATFNAAAPGAFDKSVTVTANVENGVIMLRIRGEVMANTPNN
ncbi:MAG: DUF1573 domain-containing protein [Cyclobacteriaceae bacterium]|nr:DUF1573 domain-containing protein [Cyclobacteriaceae bacterium]